GGRYISVEPVQYRGSVSRWMVGRRRSSFRTLAGDTPVTAGYNPGIRPCPARPQPAPEPRLAPTPTLIQTLGGRYWLVEPLGAGGMSVVWRAYDEVLGRRVAVKLLAPKLAADPRSRDRIREEARAAARLSHPHITAVHDYGESDGVPYVVME